MIKIEPRYNPSTTSVDVYVFKHEDGERHLLTENLSTWYWGVIEMGSYLPPTFSLSIEDAGTMIDSAIRSGIEPSAAKPSKRDESEIGYLRTVVDRLLP